MGRLARRARAVLAPGSGLPASGLARGAAMISMAAVVSVAGIGMGQLLPRGSRPAATGQVQRAHRQHAQVQHAQVQHAQVQHAQVQHAQVQHAQVQHAQLTAARALPEAILHSGAGGGQASEAGYQPAGGTARSAFRRIILPDLLIVAPQGLTRRDAARLAALTGVRNLITFDGARISVGGRSVNAIGVNPATFRSWVPLRTASDQSFWTALSSGEFVVADSAARQLKLRDNSAYKLTGGTSATVTFGSAARLGLNGVDVLVNQTLSRKLGLVHQVAALISAPGVSMTKLTRAVTTVLGPSARMESLRSQQLPVTRTGSGQSPTTYLQLFKASAARYCPGLSWTVLAAIGQIESADGTNMGPSSAGALGPMQFMPATWAEWGIDGFGQTGQPNVMDPYDAVPSAARLLCADGAAKGGHALYNAIFDYNHADWYVHEVLGLASGYAADYR